MGLPDQTPPILTSFRSLPGRCSHLVRSSHREIDRKSRDRSKYGLEDSHPILLISAVVPGVSSPCSGRVLMEYHHIS
ncbi:hypothetical protein T10_13477 [Trichinella papuae]|uniref:Uncharacterized protein n=1 Tax=Trichinella papuae TaxID=268474 RepID=A0A0V1M1F4_9BILA|nr:hypothetical protein T10_13477 [Trichinella papuae]